MQDNSIAETVIGAPCSFPHNVLDVILVLSIAHITVEHVIILSAQIFRCLIGLRTLPLSRFSGNDDDKGHCPRALY